MFYGPASANRSADLNRESAVSGDSPARGPRKLAASILSADYAHLADQVKDVESDSILIHIDCMDAHFVPAAPSGPVVVGAVRRVTDLPLHCHLMVEDRPGLLFATSPKPEPIS